MNTAASPFADLAPAPVWAHFATLCAFPRPSRAEGPLRDHLLAWARTRGLGAQVDTAGNLILRKPASPGREAAPGVALQGHLDMVCQKNAGVAHDFTRDPIRPQLHDGWLVAEDTTLGADNGIGVALALAVLEDRSLSHGPLEVLLTIDEETGMSGAQGLAAGSLQSRLMLNLDTEDWGEFYLGCAGGLDVNVSRSGRAEAVPAGHEVWRIELSGLRGGHSGVDIHEERGNAIKLLLRVLRNLEDRFSLRLAEFTGGTARNALAREAQATVVAPIGRGDALAARLNEWQTLLNTELQGVESGIRLQLGAGRADAVMAAEEQSVWLKSLHAAPHGVRRWSLAVPGVVESSNNLGIVQLTPAGGSANFMVRSLIDSGAEALADEILSLFALSGTRAEKSGHYPGWAPNPTSPLLALCQKVYARDFGGESQVKVVHAGLECGILGAKHPGMDIVSFGPTIRGAHAPGERVEVASVERCWRLLTGILDEISR